MNIATMFGFFIIAATTVISNCDGNSNIHCIESEREALLKFKQYFLDESNRLSSWVEDTDCCNWFGVYCDLTGHVKELNLHTPIDYDALFSSQLRGKTTYDAFLRSQLRGKITSSLVELKRLSFLDLSNNDFNGTSIPEFIGSMRGLSYLNLSGAYFSGQIPHKLGNLSKLQYLDLGGNFDLQSKSLQWVSGLSSLMYLDLSYMNLSTVTGLLQVTSNLSSLVELHLQGCDLNTISSPITSNFTSLAVFDLSNNQILAPIFLENLCNLRELDFSENRIDVSEVLQVLSMCRQYKLESLTIDRNHFSGQLTDQLGQFKNLTYLSLSFNSITGPIPFGIGDLSSLKFLDVSYNNLNGTLPQSIGQLTSLKTLELNYNQLSGTLPQSIGQLMSLEILSLADNWLSGTLPQSIGQLISLKTLNLNYNQLSGTLPQSIGQLQSLETLHLRKNQLQGVVTAMHFSNLSKLRTLDASENTLTFHPNQNWIPPFDCEDINIGQWNLGPQFPPWLQLQKNLTSIDISNAGISDVIPSWFSNLTLLRSVDLSYNQLVGGSSYLPLSVGRLIDLSSNKFNGPLPQLFPEFLILSENSFSGFLSEFMCNPLSKSVSVLHIDKNHLSGEIPDCWENMPKLDILNLGNNNLTGEIPTSLGSLEHLYALNLRNNSLFGELPSTLQACSSLVLLDVGENHLTGSIPTWIGKYSRLVALGLPSNNFHGDIPDQICALSSLQILDLAHNNLSGGFPKCIGNLTAMATENPHPKLMGWLVSDKIILESVLLVRKGREDEYGSILAYVTSLDLSNNPLTGTIPEELGNLKGLQSLNLSGNQLAGKIPENIGSIESLESVDFSRNRLYGEIPSSFSKLSFLSYLNLSYNNLIGKIPTSTQLQSFNKSSYIGNHLCGPPISKDCSASVRPNVTDPNDGSGRSHRPKVNGLYVSIAVGFVVGFWGVVAPLFFIRSWRFTFYTKLDDVGRKLYVFWATLGK